MMISVNREIIRALNKLVVVVDHLINIIRFSWMNSGAEDNFAAHEPIYWPKIHFWLDEIVVMKCVYYVKAYYQLYFV